MLKHSLLIFLSFVIVSANASSQTLRWRPDSLALSHNECATLDTTFPVTLYNISDTEAIVDQFGISANGWVVIDYPVNWDASGHKVAPHDSARFVLRYLTQPPTIGGGGYVFAVELNGGLCKLPLNVNKTGPRFYFDALTKSTVSYTGDTARITFIGTNPGNEDFIVTELQYSDTIFGISKGDTISPGEKIEVTFTHTSNERGSRQKSVGVKGECSGTDAYAQFYVLPYGAHWVEPTLTGAIRPCPAAKTYQVPITNSMGYPVTIDSVTIYSADGRWHLNTFGLEQKLIASGDTAYVEITREQDARANAVVSIHQKGRPDGLLQVNVMDQAARPRFKLSGDSSIMDLDWKPITLAIDIENFGVEGYRITSLEYSGSHWTLVSLDTLTTLNFHNKTEILFKFANAQTYGDYPLTFRVHGTPCDTVLQRTIIARISDPAAVGQAAAKVIQIYPNPTSNSVMVSGCHNGSYSIFDEMGGTMLQGVINGESIDISSLVSGSYIMRIVTGSDIISRAITVIR
jgi:hypothetical protein